MTAKNGAEGTDATGVDESRSVRLWHVSASERASWRCRRESAPHPLSIATTPVSAAETTTTRKRASVTERSSPGRCLGCPLAREPRRATPVAT